MKRVVIIGAGMGGLAAALRLRDMGCDVTVLEKQQRPGGRSNVFQEGGFRVDIGPTVLVMKDVFEETYRAIGRDINRRIKFVPLDPSCRIYYHDDTHVDLYDGIVKLSSELEKVEPGVTERLFEFIGENARKFRPGMDFVSRNYDQLTDLVNPTAVFWLIQIAAYRNLYAHVSKYFKTDKLRKAFSFHPLFLGLSPSSAPPRYNLITYAALVGGVYFPIGGIYSIIEDMVALAAEMGVMLRTNAPVAEILIENGAAKGVRLQSGEIVTGDIVVSNADLVYTYKKLVPAQHRHIYPDARLDRMQYACSGYVLYLGLDKVYPDMQHQAFYFSENYRANLDALSVQDPARRPIVSPQQPDHHRSELGSTRSQHSVFVGAHAESAGKARLERGCAGCTGKTAPPTRTTGRSGHPQAHRLGARVSPR